MSDMIEKVKDIIVEELGVEREKLTDSASFMEDLGADSLDTVELVMAFEKEFDIDIPDEEAEKLDRRRCAEVSPGQDGQVARAAAGRCHGRRAGDACRTHRRGDLDQSPRRQVRRGGDCQIRPQPAPGSLCL